MGFKNLWLLPLFAIVHCSPSFAFDVNESEFSTTLEQFIEELEDVEQLDDTQAQEKEKNTPKKGKVTRKRKDNNKEKAKEEAKNQAERDAAGEMKCDSNETSTVTCPPVKDEDCTDTGRDPKWECTATCEYECKSS